MSDEEDDEEEDEEGRRQRRRRFRRLLMRDTAKQRRAVMHRVEAKDWARFEHLRAGLAGEVGRSVGVAECIRELIRRGAEEG
jgi:hypothetical protein